MARSSEANKGGAGEAIYGCDPESEATEIFNEALGDLSKSKTNVIHGGLKGEREAGTEMEDDENRDRPAGGEGEL